jgi:5'-3' exonuclease
MGNEKTAVIDGDGIIYRVAAINENTRDYVKVMSDVLSLYNFIVGVTESTHFITFIAGKNNFRYQIAKRRPYKGNRKKTFMKWKAAITDFMIHELSAIRSHGAEADDYVASYACQSLEDCIICSHDKDLKQIHGAHFDLSKEQIEYISYEQSRYLLGEQLLTGDSTDNIQGLKGIGPKKAQKLLSNNPNPVLKAHEVYKEKEGTAYFTEVYELIKMKEDIQIKHSPLPSNVITNVEEKLYSMEKL